MNTKHFIAAIILSVTAGPGVYAQTAAKPQPAAPKTVSEELKEFEEKSSKAISKETLEAGRRGNEEIAASGILKSALNVGAKMPEFSLNDASGKTVSSADLLKEGNLVLVFYRGAWCPYCNLYLRGLQRHLADFKANGGTLVAISGENPDNSLSVEKKNNLEFKVLSDPGFEAARKFGIVYKVPKPVDDMAKGYGLDFKEYYKTEESELPLSATYIVRQNGEIVYAFLDPDYKKRAEPEKINRILASIKKESK